VHKGIVPCSITGELVACTCRFSPSQFLLRNVKYSFIEVLYETYFRKIYMLHSVAMDCYTYKMSDAIVAAT
jgi:hypothetical protein